MPGETEVITKMNMIPCDDCGRDEEDAEEQRAWRERRGVWEVLEISPELSKEDTVKLLMQQYEQALKQASLVADFPTLLAWARWGRRALSMFVFPPD